jgi:hypothetical protein
MNNIFIVFIFLDGIRVDWIRFDARERYQPSCQQTQSFLMPIESRVFEAHPSDRLGLVSIARGYKASGQVDANSRSGQP